MPNHKGDTLLAANDALVILGVLRETVQRSDNEHVRRQQMELLEEALRVLNASDASDDAQSEERLDAEALVQERDLLKNELKASTRKLRNVEHLLAELQMMLVDILSADQWTQQISKSLH